MKQLKLLLSFFAFAVLAMAQAGNVSTFNLCSTCAIRQFVPGMSSVPPQVQVWIYDPVASDAYFVTLSYQGIDGAAHLVTQYVPGSGQANSVWQAMVDAQSITNVQVRPMKFTGSAYQTP